MNPMQAPNTGVGKALSARSVCVVRHKTQHDQWDARRSVVSDRWWLTSHKGKKPRSMSSKKFRAMYEPIEPKVQQ